LEPGRADAIVLFDWLLVKQQVLQPAGRFRGPQRYERTFGT